METQQERIDTLFTFSLALCECIYPSSGYLAARDAITLTDNVVNIGAIDIALGNIKLDGKDFLAAYGPHTVVDFGAPPHEVRYTIAAVLFVRAAYDYLEIS